MSDIAATAVATSASAPPASPSTGLLGHALWSQGGFSFKDLLDIVNPLQHIPVVGSIYRYLTGDEPAAGTRIIGDALYGGPIGFGVSVASTALLTDAAGHDPGERLLADVFGPRDHDGAGTAGKPEVATAAKSPSEMPVWMVGVGTPDGQPATPAPASRQVAAQAAASPVAGTARPAKPMASANATPAATLPLSLPPGPQRSLAQPPSPQPSARPVASQLPVQSAPMNQLFRSPPPTGPATPEQAFLTQNSQFQRQISQGRGSNGAVLNDHPVPLELSSNLLPVMPAGGHLSLGPTVAAPAAPGPAQASSPIPPAAPDQRTIAQKMMDALDKYQQLKKQEQQQDSALKADQQKVDLAL